MGTPPKVDPFKSSLIDGVEARLARRRSKEIIRTVLILLFLGAGAYLYFMHLS